MDGPQSLVSLSMGAFLRRYDVSPTRTTLEYFHAGRGITDIREGNIDGSIRLTRQSMKYAFVRRYLEELVQEEAASALVGLRVDGIVMASGNAAGRSRFSHALSILAPKLRWEGAEREAEGWAVWFVRPTGPRVELANLADSEKAAVLFASSWAALGLGQSIAVVDHPEQGLHPEQHVAFFEGLKTLFHDGQLIAAMTSPAILRAASRSCVVVLGG